ncbi:MAG: bifunctional DNA-formamidopyrimidine glycosylase/DNA-(apurinic or apyrimidinic site) lyase [Alphaproteobacteria bacterium GM202ARS2]|nr:bifunctional DNA-formamidopyrimidine glycosylase/DNA-(apurinic or apyrimidinic site) lyase [Alphaproteobacteria bacterium GM202ARS2]
MPELPEVETIKRGLQNTVLNQTCNHVHIYTHKLRTPLPKDLAQVLTNNTITKLSRRGKYLLIHLKNQHTLIMHFGMSGSLTITPTPPNTPKPPQPRQPHDHLIIETDHHTITFNDPRRFGSIQLVHPDSSSPPLPNLAPDPLDPLFSPQHVHARLKQTTTPIKTALMNQNLISGLGNIYVCEALYHARLHPFTPSNQLDARTTRRLLTHVRRVLTQAIECGGSSLRDHKQTNGKLGYFQYHFCVYGKDKQPCPTCQTPITKHRQQGRSTFFCPQCQK